MNQPIRCEPLPFLPANEMAAGDAAACADAPESSFDEVLGADLHRSETEPEAKRKTPAEQSPWLVLSMPPPPNPPVPPKPPERLADHSQFNPADRHGVADPPEKVTANRTAESEKPRGPNGPAAPGADLIERLRPGDPAEQKLPTHPGKAPSAREHIAQNHAEPAKSTTGTVAAQRPLMLMTSQDNEKAAPSGPPLDFTCLEPDLFKQTIRPARLRSTPAGETDHHIDHSTRADDSPALTSRLDSSSGESDHPTTRTVERTIVFEAIRSHVALVRSGNRERLEVVLRPNADTEIHLSVEKVNGQILVQARCDRGDFGFLEAHWAAIQTTLAAQGIRVEHLQQGSPSNSQHSSGSFQNPSGQGGPGHRDEHDPGSIEQEPNTHRPARKGNSRSAALLGWQSWA